MRAMTRILWAVLTLCMATASYAGTAALVGTFRGPSNRQFNGYMRVQLPFAGAVDTSCDGGGSCMILPTTVQVGITNGVFDGTRLSRNGDIAPTGTYYRAAIYNADGGLVSVSNFVIPAAVATFDIGAAILTSVTTNNVSFASVATTTGTNHFTGTNTFSNINNIIYVDGFHYAQTGAGLTQAITDSIANGTREVHACGIISISSTITITTGGFSLVGCGSGGINNSLVPTTMLQWTGAGGNDIIQITGQANPRMDKVKLQNLILDGGGVARYDLRMEKVDIVSLYDVRFRNSATAGLYAVDATGIEGTNVNCGTISSYCMVLDWGTGGSIFTGIQVENDVSSTLPLVLLQGASRGITFNGFQCDGTNTNFGGCVQITGYDTNSSFASAPTGGAGAPQSVRFSNPVITIHAAATTPSQGADILITGTATNQSSHITIEGLNDLGGTVSASAVKVDQANDIEIKGGSSSSHTAASLNITSNASKVRRLFFQSISDTASCTGSGCTNMAILDESINGIFAIGTGMTFINPWSVNTGPTIAAAGCGGSGASIPINNGTASFDVNVGTAPTAGGCTITMPTVTGVTRWNCSVNDYTTISTGIFFQKQIASTASSITLQNFSDVAVATAPTASDIYHVKCGGE